MLISGIIFAMSSCDVLSGNNESESIYFTVTFHGNGHTEGEPPTPMTVKAGDNFTLPEQGTMRRLIPQGTPEFPSEPAEYPFLGWLPIDPENNMKFPFGFYIESGTILESVLDAKDGAFYAVWSLISLYTIEQNTQ